MNLSRFVLWLVCFLAGAGCATSPANNDLLLLDFPPVKLTGDEYIQQVEITINQGCVARINRPIDDWDYAVAWDNPCQQVITLSARHFSSGLGDIRRLNGFITIAANHRPRQFLRVETVLTIVKTGPGGGGVQKIKIGPEQILLEPVKPY